MRAATQRTLQTAVSDRLTIGEILIRRSGENGFVLTHRDDERENQLEIFRDPENASLIARNDDLGSYRPLKTAPNLRHGWRLEIVTEEELQCALDYFYPGRLEVFASWKQGELRTTSFRETLDRQTGMYRIAARISDGEADQVIGNFCRSDGGCLRTILWKRDQNGTIPSSRLPPEKFDPTHPEAANMIPLICQEACNLLVAECRKTVKMEGAAPSAPE
jgi:sirohydrochlorin cobaltochelatase